MFHPKKSDLPLHQFHPREQPKLKKWLKKPLVYALTVILLWWIFWPSHSETLHYSDEEKLLRAMDFERLSKYDEGVDKWLIDHEGTVTQGTPQYTEYLKDREALYHSTVEYWDLNDYQGHPDGEEQGDLILLLIPLRNAESVLPLMFKHMMNLTYPHSLIDVAFLVSDCSPDDHTLEALFDYSIALQHGNLSKVLDLEDKEKSVKGSTELHLNYMSPEYLDQREKSFAPPFHKGYDTPFRSVEIFKKDFGQVIGQGFTDRHDVKVQGIRRKLMGRARNWLTANALKPYHSWVYWRDADVELMPGDIIQNLMKFDYDVIVPNVWRPLPEFLGKEQAYDLNSWMESEQGLALAKKLDEDDVIVEGYAEYPTWRVHLGYIRKPDGNLGHCSVIFLILCIKLYWLCVNFVLIRIQNVNNAAEIGKMLTFLQLLRQRRIRITYVMQNTIWHIYELSEDDLKEIAKKERKKRRSGKRE
ncbi:K05530 mannan polymerase I complex VAN1 subunit [Cyberlindnera jadinii]|uniref:K05530 mannan polymerase I complex VAN1 subunit n=1 Tax=Cyberlindnera jadinii (strain ATCC 18201 / CBS 1600 / BCRC 20928 / JCM 3617 / NBRC 0987 / NRRL Y-1542) TaxID=983966 RepID=A0A0H5C1C3_CYBJN|nr:K05530 mannan polymerase I complex VAN1 subunit [Cyberlindnera jadinii]